jgi:predicted nucleotidyltransferase
MLNITNEHLAKLELIKQRYLGNTCLPEPDNWKSKSNNEIWLKVIEQVMLVGRSSPAEKFSKDLELQKKVSYEQLLKIKDDENQLKKVIHEVLRAVKTRYASASIEKCRKTKALVHNFKVLSEYKDGPKGLLEEVSKFNTDKEKIKYIMSKFKYIKSKGARDFLMDLGLVRDAIALDARIQNVLEKIIGIEIPKDLLEKIKNNSKLYDEVEEELLLKVCKPLNLSGIEFDRMIYQNYKEIKNGL